MIPELGVFALILAFFAALLQALTPCFAHYSSASRDLLWNQLTIYLTCIQVGFLLLCFGCLEYALLSNDFSVLYVAQNSSSELPIFYRFSALWGAHEGSVLLWILLLNFWALGIILLYKNRLATNLLSNVLGILGFISSGLLLFLLLTSNPFRRLLPNFPTEGQDLNPLLQDIGLAIHPPMLYLGYVGFGVVFAFAMVGMLCRHLDKDWLRAMRGITALAFSFLTLGITLGSWWAYRELGWGGWWFWDPVENASFLPWLTGAAMLHILVLNEKRDRFKGWMVLLSICAFSLSLMGTFLVRSGILTSVHAFANDPGRGVFLFAFLVLVIGGSLLLYAWRLPTLEPASSVALCNRLLSKLALAREFEEGSERRTGVYLSVHEDSSTEPTHKFPAKVEFRKKSNQEQSDTDYYTKKYFWLSREFLLLANNVILMVAMATILLGTLYPLILDVLNLGKISVGAPYFNIVFAPLMLLVLLLMALVPSCNWEQISLKNILQAIMIGSLIILGVFILFHHDHFSFSAILGAAFATWVIIATLKSIIVTIIQRKASLNMAGMWLAHFGLGICALGIVLTSVLSIERDVRMMPGDTATLGAYQFHFMGLYDLKGANFNGVQANFNITKQAKNLATLTAEKRIYHVQNVGFTKPAILAGFWHDFYIALGAPLTEKLNGPWAVRLYYKPFVRWLWLGGLLILAGGLCAAVSSIRRSA